MINLNFYNRINKIFKLLNVSREASALLLTMFILAGMLLVAMSSSYIVTLGIKAGGIQAQSTKAYFIAESGIERFLWELRRHDSNYDYFNVEDVTVPVFQSDDDSFVFGGNYNVYISEIHQLKHESIGEFGNTKRAVEVDIY